MLQFHPSSVVLLDTDGRIRSLNAAVILTLHADTLPGGAIALFNASGTDVAPEVITGADRVTLRPREA